ncbi:ATPdependent RNA helicase [Blyttiomyces sp. JEL0837]|nr:ATPdependent RNA helicase [Blyttiomyces sp. JEL0837]
MGPKKGSSSSSSGPSGSSSGKSGKGKNAAPPEPPKLFVPEPGQKLTREQHAILRAQRAKAAEEEKKALFGSWTGKTPVSVLYEQCQRMEWNKAEVNVAKKTKGWQGTVVISNEDKRTREKKRFVYCDFNKFAPTEQEAKHWAATYALHRFCSHLSVHRLLPPAHQQYWAELEVIRKNATAEEQLYEYSPDPFLAEEAKAKAEKERQRAEKEAQEKAAKVEQKLLAPWEQYQSVTLTEGMRNLIEDLVRQAEEQEDDDGGESNVGGGLSESDKQRVIEQIVERGFRKAHAVESLGCCQDLTSALDWLCIYVPEDDRAIADLPPSFMVKQKEIAAGQNTPAALAKEWAVKRMVHSGFSHKACGEAYDISDASELKALAYLATSLIDDPSALPPPPDDLDPEELRIAFEDEVEALKSIYGEEAFSLDMKRNVMCITINSNHDGVILDFGVPEGSLYPYVLPALVVRCETLPAYIKLGILKATANEAVKCIGAPMIYSLVSWLEENINGLIENPPPLRSLVKEKTMTTKLVPKTESSPQIGGKSKKPRGQYQKSKSPEEIAAEGERLKKLFEAKSSSAEFQRMLKDRQRLPSASFRENIVKAVETNSAVIICGETGCGKSTQTGQFLLEGLLKSGQAGACNIVCTQPRRISAMSLAERVAAEQAEKIGQTIGYAIRGETVRGKDTKLMFCTAGILLRMLQNDPKLKGITHVIVDEVHERSVDGDFLLVILRELIVARPDCRLILMSATVNSETFSAYFGHAPVLNIPGFTHPVTQIYLEDFFASTKYIPDGNNRPRRPKAKITASGDKENAQQDVSDNIDFTKLSLDPKALEYLSAEGPDDPLDYTLISHIVKHICTKIAEEGAILIFLQGAMEIKKCIDTIKYECPELSLELLPLHANLSARDQSAVFRRPRASVRKIVVATNIAETSITIEDVVYVIDSGRVKEMQFENKTLRLTDTLASRASCKQRQGRAGRVRPGTCFKLFSRKLEKNHMLAHPVPEILRVPLEQLCLSLKAMGVNDVVSFLSQAIDPPPSENIADAVGVLTELRAVDSVSGELTPLGKHMAAIPADLRIAKMLIFGCIFHCLDPVLTIAAIMSSKSPFVIPPDQRQEGREARAQFTWDKSDWLTDCRVFDAWLDAYGAGRAKERSFCEKNFLSSTTLVSISDLRKQYLENLIEAGFAPRDDQSSVNVNSKHARVIKASIVAGLYPQLVSIKLPEVTYLETAHGAMAKEAETHEISFLTKDDGRVFLHPSSILFSTTKYEDSFLVYHMKVSTSKVFIRDATMVSPWPVLMFGGQLNVDHNGRTVEVDGFCKFQAFPRIAVCENDWIRHCPKS